ncbi:hypothetical protein CSUI_009915 [Cystoisospora suis]|uniref:Uncharacterized protein n=1 Tax=Cystoisospora suis TaxID=483139 RepID=A0A2C6KGM5_9APIC|nr:hypothetical protein CSUI_009915 [Cystoisospora suis]
MEPSTVSLSIVAERDSILDGVEQNKPLMRQLLHYCLLFHSKKRKATTKIDFSFHSRFGRREQILFLSLSSNAKKWLDEKRSV